MITAAQAVKNAFNFYSHQPKVADFLSKPKINLKSMITEEKARAGHEAAAQMAKEQVKKLYNLVQNEMWEDAAEITADIMIALVGVTLSENFLNG